MGIVFAQYKSMIYIDNINYVWMRNYSLHIISRPPITSEVIGGLDYIHMLTICIYIQSMIYVIKLNTKYLVYI